MLFAAAASSGRQSRRRPARPRATARPQPDRAGRPGSTRSAQSHRTTCQPRSRSRSSRRFSSTRASSGDCPGLSSSWPYFVLPSNSPRVRCSFQPKSQRPTNRPRESRTSNWSVGTATRFAANTSRLIDSPALSLRASSMAAVRRAWASPRRGPQAASRSSSSSAAQSVRSAAAPIETASIDGGPPAWVEHRTSDARPRKATDLDDVVCFLRHAVDLDVAPDLAVALPVAGEMYPGQLVVADGQALAVRRPRRG